MENYRISIFDSVNDPRVTGRCSHLLSDILFIATCTLICNGEDCQDMEEFGLSNKSWLMQYLSLPNGIPTHDTFNRVLQKIDPQELESILYNEGVDILRRITEKHIAIDGKKIRGASPKSKGNTGLYILNAWVSTYNLCIGQRRIENKKNEISAIPELLRSIDIENSVVSIDAIGCQKEIARQIKSQNGDYILSVKENQKNLFEEINEIFSYAKIEEKATEYEKDHGRIEARTCHLLAAQEHLSPNQKEKWSSIKKLVKITSMRIIDDAQTISDRYYITSSNTKSAKEINKLIRNHWSIENNLHWHLDVTFNEDDCRLRTGYAPENMNLLRKLALTKIRKQEDKKSLKKRRYKASMDKDYLLKLITN